MNLPSEKNEYFPQERLVFATSGQKNNFFGYYDKSPLDQAGERLLCLQTKCAAPLPGDTDQATIGFWDLKLKTFHPFSQTRAFNWQQGCMLQWLGPDFNQNVIFNDRRKGRFVAVVHDTKTDKEKIIPFPVYAVHPNGKMALGVDFERLYFLRRNYAYAGVVREEKNTRLDAGDGIFHVNLESGNIRLLISTADMAGNLPLSSMEAGAQYLEHLMFSPSGKRFMFLHRWNLPDGGIYTRLYTADSKDGGNLRLLNDSGKVTHACWRSEEEILCWGALPSALGALRTTSLLSGAILKPLKALYHALGPSPGLTRRVTGTSYLIIRDDKGKETTRLAPDILTQDGHPGINPASPRWLLSDTYQDKNDIRALILFDLERQTRIDLGMISSPDPFNDPPGNCDLHPRWDFSGRHVIIDSGREGRRQMYVFDVSGIVGPTAP